MRISAFSWILVGLFATTAASRDDEISRWTEGLRGLLKGCPPTQRGNPDSPDLLGNMLSCLQHRAVLAVDALLTDDVIPILDGIDLVRYREDGSDETDEEFDSDRRNDADDGEETPEGGNDEGWREIVGNRLVRLFRSHALRIDLERASKATGLSSSEGEAENVSRGRRRRQKRKGMLPVAMMGFLFMGSILIPMGFQFLAVLGGKALILAKMALMLSSIQGLKKIATSGVSYGLYHSPVSEGWHERSIRPESVAPIEPTPPPPPPPPPPPQPPQPQHQNQSRG